MNFIKVKSIFCDNLNGKAFEELPFILRKAIAYMYNDIKNDDVIYAKRVDDNLVDIKVRDIKRRMILLNGNTVNIGIDKVWDFIFYLLKNGISKDVIKAILYYHFGDGTLNGAGTLRLQKEQLKWNHRQDIELVNSYFKNNKDKLELVMKRIFKNRFDYVYYGNLDAAMVIDYDTFFYNVLNHTDNYSHEYMRIGEMNYQVLERYILFNPELEWKRIYIYFKLVNIKKYFKAK